MFDRERFNLRRLNELEVRKQYQFEITDRFGALENLSDSEEINTAGRTLKRISKRFNLRRLNELEVRKQYQFEITDRFGAL